MIAVVRVSVFQFQRSISFSSQCAPVADKIAWLAKSDSRVDRRGSFESMV